MPNQMLQQTAAAILVLESSLSLSAAAVAELIARPQLAMHIHWSENKEKGNMRLWFDGVLVLDKKLKTKGPENIYFCQPGIHRSPPRPSVDTIYFDNFILADTLEDVLAEGPKAPR